MGYLGQTNSKKRWKSGSGIDCLPLIDWNKREWRQDNEPEMKASLFCVYIVAATPLDGIFLTLSAKKRKKPCVPGLFGSIYHEHISLITILDQTTRNITETP